MRRGEAERIVAAARRVVVRRAGSHRGRVQHARCKDATFDVTFDAKFDASFFCVKFGARFCGKNCSGFDVMLVAHATIIEAFSRKLELFLFGRTKFSNFS